LRFKVSGLIPIAIGIEVRLRLARGHLINECLNSVILYKIIIRCM
jgi:hypothetical protein